MFAEKYVPVNTWEMRGYLIILGAILGYAEHFSKIGDVYEMTNYQLLAVLKW